MKPEQLIQSLKSVCTHIDESWNQLIDSWGDDATAFIKMSVINRYVIDQIDQEDTKDFPAIFNVIEQAVIQGDSEVLTLIKSGFLEGIIMIGSHSHLSEEDFFTWMGTQTQQLLQQTH